MQYLNISNFTIEKLNKILDIAGRECNKIFVVDIGKGIYIEDSGKIIKLLDKYIIKYENVKKWDGTERIITKDNPCARQYVVDCNEETINILKSYWKGKNKGIFSPGSEYEIAFYKDDIVYFFTTPHEDSICFSNSFYEMLEKKY